MDTNEKVEELNAKFCNGETDLSDILREAMAWRVREDARVAEERRDAMRNMAKRFTSKDAKFLRERANVNANEADRFREELSRIADSIEKGE